MESTVAYNTAGYIYFVESTRESRVSPFECLFEVVGDGGERELAELAVLCTWPDSGSEPLLDGRERRFGLQRCL